MPEFVVKIIKTGPRVQDAGTEALVRDTDPPTYLPTYLPSYLNN